MNSLDVRVRFFEEKLYFAEKLSWLMHESTEFSKFIENRQKLWIQFAQKLEWKRSLNFKTDSSSLFSIKLLKDNAM